MIGDFFSAVIAKIAAALDWFFQLYVACYVALWDLVRDAFCWPFEQLMDLVVLALASLDLSGLSGYSASWGSLPSEIINVLGLIGVGHASAIIVTAIGIRLVLQLIPFTRLGS